MLIANSSTINASLSADSDTVIVQVFLLATTQTSSTFNLVLSNLVPSGQAALATLTSTFTAGLTIPFGNVNRSFKIEFNAKKKLIDFCDRFEFLIIEQKYLKFTYQKEVNNRKILIRKTVFILERFY
jgi:hypothetical protein